LRPPEKDQGATLMEAIFFLPLKNKHKKIAGMPFDRGGDRRAAR